MTALSEKQIKFFWDNGYLVAENAVSSQLLERLQQDFVGWVDESREHSHSYGKTIDDKPRFNLEDGHLPNKPALRRVNAPVEVSQAYYEAMAESDMTDMVSALIGPGLKFHHSKINSKLPGSSTAVKWHQDFTFTPHTNDDVVTALLMVDEVTNDNGPLEVAAGSHRGALHTLWHDGVFSGSVDQKVADEVAKEARLCLGKAGTVCLMHSRLLHASTANQSPDPRTLFICVYSAEDSVPVSPNPMPNKYEGQIVRGERSGKVRCVDYQMDLPELPKSGVFFDQQSVSEQS